MYGAYSAVLFYSVVALLYDYNRCETESIKKE